tara:strand:- start:1225 stop:1803 length:579 start_codon:yes stop_codon:yes gene_type:complete
MRFEIILFLVAGFILANIYTDGKYTKLMVINKKYIQMGGVAFATLMIYLLVKKNPLRAKDIVTVSNDYIKYLPLDNDTTNIISPILDFTSKQNFYDNHIDNGNQPVLPVHQNAENKIMNSGKKGTKRSVSETKKKFVASRQQWNCNDCNSQLNAWFEVDHVVRLEHGGSNHIDNLVALCRECHGKKTTIENL